MNAPKPLLAFLKVVGVTLVLVGLVGAYYGPIEIFVFNFFSDGGQFHYAGFGVGSFWFATLVVLNLGYYVVAAVCLPLGIGHFKLRRWTLTLTQLTLWFGLGAGILLLANSALLILPVLQLGISRDVLLSRLAPIELSLLVFLVLLPALGLWFYRSERVKAVFEQHDPNRYWTEKYPFALLAVLLLFVIIIVVLHLAIFFQGLFPMFGQIALGRQSVRMISLCIVIAGVLTYGLVNLKTWAWWGSFVYLTLLATSSILSFARHSFGEMIATMDLPAYEVEFLGKLTYLHDFYLAFLFAAPLLIALGLIVYSKRYFRQ